MSARRRILVTGFEAFGGETVNPTQKLVDACQAGEVAVPHGVEVRALTLPVVFGEGFAKLEKELRSFKPGVVLSFGQAGGRNAIEFERVAVNLIDGEQTDNSGKSHRDVAIDPSGPNALFSTLPIRELVERLTSSGVPAKVSNSAGLYVCNELFYRLQSATLRTTLRSGFVHVPYLEEQARPKSAPFMSFEDMKKALGLMLEHFA